jgi:hypothetical protein
MQFLAKKNPVINYILPAVVVLLAIWRIFVRQLPAQSGLGFDGYDYYLLALQGLHSGALNTYMALRCYPSFLIRTVFGIFRIDFSPANVILGFKLMNLILIGISALMVKRIFDRFKLDFISQLTGFTLIYMSYGVLNFTFYYPVMTDTPAFFLSTAMFYFFIEGQLLNVLLTGLIGAFTWPILLPMALSLALFPNTRVEYKPLNKKWLYGIAAVSALYAVIAGYYFLFVQGEKPDMVFLLPLKRSMLVPSYFGVALMFFLMPFVLNNKTLFTLSYFKSQLKLRNVLAVAGLIAVFLAIRLSMTVNTGSKYLTPYMILKNHHYAFTRPLITLACHFNYFGVIVLLIGLFWYKYSAFVSKFGLGVAGSILFNMFVLGTLPESRTLIHLFAWLAILMALFLGQYRFSKWFYFGVIAVNLLMAKLWLFFTYYDSIEDNPVLSDGTVDFPDQWFYMHLGVWVTEGVWFWLCIIALICLLLLFFTVYRVKIGQKALLFYKKFEPLKYG